jgi:hypothetical protein
MDASDPERPGAESDLGIVLFSKFGETGDRIDLDRAIELQRRAVSAAGPGHPDRARRLLNLSGPLRRRYEQFGALADLDESVATLRTVVFDLPYPGRRTSGTDGRPRDGTRLAREPHRQARGPGRRQHDPAAGTRADAGHRGRRPAQGAVRTCQWSARSRPCDA